MSDKRETELTFYAKLGSLEGLDQAEVIEEHFQMESTYITGPRTRVRRTVPVKGGPEGAADTYVQAIKIKVKDKGGVSSNLEHPAVIDRQFYEAFGEVAERGMYKVRYVFTGELPQINGQTIPGVPPLVYEVDVFKNKDKEIVPWVKIDVELDKFNDAMEAHGFTIDDIRHKLTFESLPLQLSGIFYGPDQTEDQAKLLDYLWKEQFTIALNPVTYVKEKEVQPPPPVIEPAQSEEEENGGEDNPATAPQ